MDLNVHIDEYIFYSRCPYLTNGQLASNNVTSCFEEIMWTGDDNIPWKGSEAFWLLKLDFFYLGSKPLWWMFLHGGFIVYNIMRSYDLKILVSSAIIKLQE